MRRLPGFTLIEIVLAIFILMLLLLLAVPSLTGVLADRRLRRKLDSFNALVNQAHERSVAERRPYLLVIDSKAILLRPEILTKDDDPAPVAELPLADRESITLGLPAALKKDPPPEWVFWPSGACEPAEVQFSGREGVWTVDYSPLNARPEVLNYAPR